MRRQSELWVVKIGGSLAGSDELAVWIELLGRYRKPRVVIVPGGGAFADQVRTAQRQYEFDDGVAHRMALLAMDQMGLMLSGLTPWLHPATSRRTIAAIHRRGGVPVWLPTRMVAGRKDIPESWDVTSDSLAAWLATAIAANRLVLVKAVEPPPGRASVAELRRLGLLDEAFARFIAGRSFDSWCIGATKHQEMARALQSGNGPGTRIVTRG